MRDQCEVDMWRHVICSTFSGAQAWWISNSNGMQWQCRWLDGQTCSSTCRVGTWCLKQRPSSLDLKPAMAPSRGPLEDHIRLLSINLGSSNFASKEAMKAKLRQMQVQHLGPLVGFCMCLFYLFWDQNLPKMDPKGTTWPGCPGCWPESTSGLGSKIGRGWRKGSVERSSWRQVLPKCNSTKQIWPLQRPSFWFLGYDRSKDGAQPKSAWSQARLQASMAEMEALRISASENEEGMVQLRLSEQQSSSLRSRLEQARNKRQVRWILKQRMLKLHVTSFHKISSCFIQYFAVLCFNFTSTFDQNVGQVEPGLYRQSTVGDTGGSRSIGDGGAVCRAEGSHGMPWL